MEHPSADGDHGGPAVLQLLELDFLGHVEVEGVPSQIAGEAAGLEAGGDSAVVEALVLAALVGQLVQLDDGDGREHLRQALGGDVLHGLEGGHGGQVGDLDALADAEVFVGGDVVERPAEFVKEEAGSGQHGGAAVLELGGPEEFAGVLRSPLPGQLVPDGLTEESDGGQIADGLGGGLESTAAARLGRRAESISARGEQKGGDALHHGSENTSRKWVRVSGPEIFSSLK